MNTIEDQEKELIAHLEQLCPNNNERLDIGNGITIYRMEKGTSFDCWQFSAYGMNTYIHVREKTNRIESIGFHRQLLGITQAAEIKRLKAALMTIRLDALDKRSRHEGLNANETLHTIKNALKPQESEAQHG